jgi:GT2 family glycosyltransferase
VLLDVDAGGAPALAASRAGGTRVARARVVVTTYERLRWLRLALRGWLRQSWRDFALTVADDGSGPSTRAFVEEFARSAPFRVDHVWREHRGYRRASILNEAVRRSRGESLLVFTDGDCVPPADFLEGHVRAHAPRSFAVGGAYRLDEDESSELTEADVDAGRVDSLRPLRERVELLRKRWKSLAGTWLRRRDRPKVVGLNVGIDRALFDEVNGFDESFVGYGLEDTDLRDRVMATRPRPLVRVLFGRHDTRHLWHPPEESAGLHVNRDYYLREGRPIRCERGLSTERAPARG